MLLKMTATRQRERVRPRHRLRNRAAKKDEPQASVRNKQVQVQVKGHARKREHRSTVNSRQGDQGLCRDHGVVQATLNPVTGLVTGRRASHLSVPSSRLRTIASAS